MPLLPYPGNNMFQMLGNLAVNPQAGLLFIDFASGHTLQMSGTAVVLWDDATNRRFNGARRVIRFSVRQTLFTTHGCRLRA